MRKRAKWIVGLFGLATLGLTAFYGPTVVAFARQGFFDRLPDKVEYSADREGNLRALHTALLSYHESEDKFPDANGWMDAIAGRLQTNDLKKGEAEKKLIRPGVASGFGYALNADVAGKHRLDLGEAPDGMVLVYESEDLARNASGTPPDKAVGIDLGGKIVGLASP